MNDSAIDGDTWRTFREDLGAEGVPDADLKGIVSNATLAAVLGRADRTSRLTKHGGRVSLLVDDYTRSLATVVADEAGYVAARGPVVRRAVLQPNGDGHAGEAGQPTAPVDNDEPEVLSEDAWAEFTDTAGDLGVEGSALEPITSNASLRRFLQRPDRIRAMGDDPAIDALVEDFQRRLGLLEDGGDDAPSPAAPAADASREPDAADITPLNSIPEVVDAFRVVIAAIDHYCTAVDASDNRNRLRRALEMEVDQIGDVSGLLVFTDAPRTAEADRAYPPVLRRAIDTLRAAPINETARRILTRLFATIDQVDVPTEDVGPITIVGRPGLVDGERELASHIEHMKLYVHGNNLGSLSSDNRFRLFQFAGLAQAFNISGPAFVEATARKLATVNTQWLGEDNDRPLLTDAEQAELAIVQELYQQLLPPEPPSSAADYASWLESSPAVGADADAICESVDDAIRVLLRAYFLIQKEMKILERKQILDAMGLGVLNNLRHRLGVQHEQVVGIPDDEPVEVDEVVEPVEPVEVDELSELDPDRRTLPEDVPHADPIPLGQPDERPLASAGRAAEDEPIGALLSGPPEVIEILDDELSGLDPTEFETPGHDLTQLGAHSVPESGGQQSASLLALQLEMTSGLPDDARLLVGRIIDESERNSAAVRQALAASQAREAQLLSIVERLTGGGQG